MHDLTYILSNAPYRTTDPRMADSDLDSTGQKYNRCGIREDPGTFKEISIDYTFVGNRTSYGARTSRLSLGIAESLTK